MEANFNLPSHGSKQERYEAFLKSYEALIEGSEARISLLANTTAALREAFGFFWVGFYLVEGDELILGPFQGSVACYRIRKGRGVCGTAWMEERTLVVPDVDRFPGHIACSSLSRSEIVVPLRHAHRIIGVLDIDSDHLSAFDDVDAEYLEKIVLLLMQALPTQ